MPVVQLTQSKVIWKEEPCGFQINMSLWGVSSTLFFSRPTKESNFYHAISRGEAGCRFAAFFRASHVSRRNFHAGRPIDTK